MKSYLKLHGGGLPRKEKHEKYLKQTVEVISKRRKLEEEMRFDRSRWRKSLENGYR